MVLLPAPGVVPEAPGDHNVTAATAAALSCIGTAAVPIVDHNAYFQYGRNRQNGGTYIVQTRNLLYHQLPRTTYQSAVAVSSYSTERTLVSVIVSESLSRPSYQPRVEVVGTQLAITASLSTNISYLQRIILGIL